MWLGWDLTHYSCSWSVVCGCGMDCSVHCTVLYYTVLRCTGLDCTEAYTVVVWTVVWTRFSGLDCSTVLYCIGLYSTVLYFTVAYTAVVCGCGMNCSVYCTLLYVSGSFLALCLWYPVVSCPVGLLVYNTVHLCPRRTLDLNRRQCQHHLPRKPRHFRQCFSISDSNFAICNTLWAKPTRDHSVLSLLGNILRPDFCVYSPREYIQQVRAHPIVAVRCCHKLYWGDQSRLMT